MNGRDLFFPERHKFSEEENREYAGVELIYNVTEDILLRMESLNMTKADVARSLGRSRSYISQVLNGSRNMTLATFSDICYAVGLEPKIELKTSDNRTQWSTTGYIATNRTVLKKTATIHNLKDHSSYISSPGWLHKDRLKIANHG